MKNLSMKTKMALAVSLMFVAVIALLAWCTLSFLEKSFDKTVLTQQLTLVSSYFLLAAVAITIAVLAITWFMMRRLTRDITERKKTEEALHDKTLLLEQEAAERKTVQEALAIKQRQLEELNGCLEARIFSAVNDLRQKDQALIQQSRLAVMGEMINNIAHQWRQPLNNIGLIVQGIGFNMESGELNRSEVREDVENIMNLIVFMSSTIDDFSNFFRQDKQRHSFSINKSVKSALDFIGAGLKSSNIRVDLQADDKVTVTGYRNEYAQVLLNILSNARDVLLERKVRDPAIYIRISTEDGRSIVTISDNAGGIPEDVLPRIFDPYFTTKEIGKGTGIGLYMSKVIIEQNIGGSLTVCNAGVGAEFRIEV